MASEKTKKTESISIGIKQAEELTELKALMELHTKKSQTFNSVIQQLLKFKGNLQCWKMRKAGV